jgi:hypothetical protein
MLHEQEEGPSGEDGESILIDVAQRIIKVATLPGHHRVDAGRSSNPQPQT